MRLPSGEEITVHCPNSGSMKGCQPPNARAWISDSHVPGRPPPQRKLRHTLELIEVDGAMVCVNTQRPNALAEEAIRAGRLPALVGYPTLNREVKFGEKSRLDLQLVDGARICWVEVKNVTMGVGEGISRFPDAVTTRGRKHLEELKTAVEAGQRAVLLFCVGRDDTRLVQPADAIDPAYGETLRAVVAAGVEVIAHRLTITPTGTQMDAAVPVDLG